MNIKLKRQIKTEQYTIGDLYIENEFECFTMEDRVRPKGIIIRGRTAIPSGKYEIIINFSNRFQVLMPLLLNVPGFEGIRIHPGNTEKDL